MSMFKIRDLILRIRTFLRERLNYHSSHLPYYIVILLALIFFVLALNVFVEFSERLINNEIHRFDNRVSEYVLDHRSAKVTAAMRILTDLGDLQFYIVIVLALAVVHWYRKSWTYFIQISIVLILAALANVFLKRWFERERPAVEHLVGVADHSYPSGHAMVAMAFYGFLIYLVMQKIDSLWGKVLLSVGLILIILIIGISRIYLGVHYPSDVVAGFMGGLIWLALCIIIYNVIDLRRKRQLVN